MADPTVTIDFVASPESVARLEATITNAIASGFAQAFNKGGAKAQSAWREAEADIKNAARAFKDADKWAMRLTDQTVNSAKFVDHLAAALKKAGWEGREWDRVMQGTNQRNRALLIDSRTQTDRASIERQRMIERETKVIAQEMRTQGELQVNAAKVAGKQRVAITQFTLNSLMRMERAFGAMFKGVASAATSTVSRMFSSIGSLARRHNNDFTGGLNPALNSRERMLGASFRQQEGILRGSAARQSAVLADMNRRTSSGLLGAATGRGIGGGLGLLAGGAGVAGLLSSGFTRFSDLERINMQFKALTGNVEDANMLLAEAREFAKTTPFDLVGVSDLAKGFLAIKMPIDQVMKSVRTISDAVALTGGNSDNLVRIQRAIGQVVSAGRLQGDELNQLAENLPGLNIRQILADQLTGGDVQALVKLQEAGKLSADQFVTGLMGGLGSDPRLAGASQALASTLAGRAANLKESFSDFGAALIGLVAGPLKVAMTGIQVGLQFLADLIKGDVSPALKLLRTGLMGVAVGMGAIIALKGAVEVVGLLGKTVGLATSPFGLLLLAAGGIGAALAVMVERSDALREAFGKIGAAVRGVVARIGEALAPVVDRVGVAFAEKVVPAIDGFADALGRTLIPVLEQFGELVVGTLIPAAVNLATGGFRLLAPVFTAVGAALSTIRPLLQPAIGGFVALGRAVGSTFRGEGGLGAGLGAALGGIGGTVAGLAGAVLAGLRPIASRVLAFLGDVFSANNLRRLASGFLQFVEEAGRIIGTIVTHPMFVKALAGIAAAAVIVGLRFAEGFIRGVLSNLPDLFKLVTGLLSKLFLSSFKTLAVTLGVVLAAVTFGPKLMARFRTAGGEAGTSFWSGFKTKASSGAQFLSGVLGRGGTGLERELAGVRRQYAAINVERRALGAPGVGLGFLGSDVRNLDAAKLALRGATSELATLKSGFTDAEIAGRMWRYRLLEGFKAVRGSVSGFAQVIGGAASGLTSMVRGTIDGVTAMYRRGGGSAGGGFLSAFKAQTAGGWTAVRGGFTAIADSFRTWATNTGKTTGQAFAGALKGAAVGAAAGFVGFQAGQAEGQSGGSGVMSAATTGLIAGSVGGPIVGGIAAGAALIGAAWGRSKKAAEDFTNAVKGVADTVKGAYAEAMKDGQIKTGEWAKLLDGTGDGSLRESLLAALGPDQIKVFADAGISLDTLMHTIAGGKDAWKTLGPAVIASGGDFDDMRNKIKAVTSVLEGNKKAIEDLQNLNRFVNGDGTALVFDGWEAAKGETARRLAEDARAQEDHATKVRLAMRGVARTREELDARLRLPLPVPGMDDFTRGMNEAIIALGTSSAEQLRTELAKLPVGSLEYKVKFAELELEKARISDTISTAISAGIADGSITSESELMSAFTTMKELLGPEGKAIADALLDGLMKRFKERTNQVAVDFTRSFVGYTRVGFGIESPSKVFAKIGGYVVDGFAQGIDRGLSTAAAAADRMRNVTATVAAATGAVPGAAAGRSTSINNNIYLPTGDPQAAALAVTNRQMALLWA